MLNRIEETPDYTKFCESKLADPYPLYARLRSEDPVHYSDRLQTWIVTRYEDVKSALNDARLSSDKMAFYMNTMSPKDRKDLDSLSQYMTQWMSMKDRPDHTRLRGLVNKAFTSKSLQDLLPEIQRICDDLVDNFISENKKDLIEHIAYPLPATVICEMLGIPTKDQTQFRKWSNDIVAFSAGLGSMIGTVAQQAQSSQKALVDYCQKIIAQRRKNPRNDLISGLIAAEEDGAQLTESELYAMCVQLFVAGQETTTNLIANSVLTLIKNPEAFKLLRDNPALITPAIEEFLRYESPVQRTSRVAKSDLEMGGKRIKEGQSVILMFGSANRDPEQFPDPDELILHRTPNIHLAFGRGPHFCLGAPLARQEAQITLTTILKKMPDIQSAGSHSKWRPVAGFRALESLIIELPGDRITT